MASEEKLLRFRKRGAGVPTPPRLRRHIDGDFPRGIFRIKPHHSHGAPLEFNDQQFTIVTLKRAFKPGGVRVETDGLS